jgi:hypothetical protein
MRRSILLPWWPAKRIAALLRGAFGRTKLPSAAALTAALGLLSATAAMASIPDTAGVIHGCYNKHNGELRVIDIATDAACRKNELPIQWNH